MSGSRKKWSFRRWRRRWKDRLAKAVLHLRIWTDRYIISHKKRRSWKRKWKRRSEQIGRQVESVGFKVIPHRPDAAPDTRWTRFKARVQSCIDRRIYPVEMRVRHGHAAKSGWRQFTSPFRHASAWGRHWIDSILLPTLTPAGFRKQFFNWKGACMLVVVGGGLVAMPLWALPAWRHHNQEKWAAQAKLLLSRGYIGLANQKAARVLRQNIHHVETCRVVADMHEGQGMSDAIAWRRRVVDGDNAVSNQLALAATAIKFETAPSPTATRVLSGLSGNATNSPLFHVVTAQFETRAGNLSEAETHYQIALTKDGSNTETEFALALVRLRQRDPDKVALAEQTLIAMAAQSNLTARALRPLVLLAANRGDYETGLEHSAQILTSESPTLEDRLVHLGLLFQKRDPQREAYLSTLQTQVSANPIFIAQVASWMTDNGMARSANQWMRALPKPIRESDAVAISMAESFASLGDWRGLDRYLLERRWGTIEFVRQAMLARANRGLKDSRAAEAYFRRSKDLASGMSLRLINLTRMVVTWGWENETDELLWEILDRYPKEAWAADSLLRRHWERNNTEGLYQVFQLQVQRAPHDAYVKNNLAMVMLLLRRDLPRAHRLALEAHQQAPGNAVNTSTYAFSLLVQGRVGEARKTIETIDKEILKTPSVAAYYAIITEAAGDTATARQFLPIARQAKLLPEEKALLDRIPSKS